MTTQEIQEKLEQLPETFTIQVCGHPQQITKCKLTGKVAIMKSCNLPAVVLGKIRDDERTQYAFIIKMVGNGAKFTASRRDFVI